MLRRERFLKYARRHPGHLILSVSLMENDHGKLCICVLHFSYDCAIYDSMSSEVPL